MIIINVDIGGTITGKIIIRVIKKGITNISVIINDHTHCCSNASDHTFSAMLRIVRTVHVIWMSLIPKLFYPSTCRCRTGRGINVSALGIGDEIIQIFAFILVPEKIILSDDIWGCVGNCFITKREIELYKMMTECPFAFFYFLEIIQK